MATNPSHILIARNSRGHNNPSASLSSPTETHAAAAGIFRSAGSPPWLLEECDTDDLIDETFTRTGRFPGTVKIVVESTTFWKSCSFASPFFEAALSGSWLETGRPQSMTLEEMSSGRFKDKPKAADNRRSSRRGSQNTHATVKRRRRTHDQDAVIILKEEKANIFHDFLKFVYPNLQCNISWNNLCVPALQQECLTFLLTHAAGKPIKAMRISELFEEEELYRESSRFVLDNPGGWSEDELSTLSQETLLKLEKRRNWFLERVLKLGLTPVAKEYQCCPTCPDPANCARLLEDKWRQAYNAVFRFGPCQPSMVYRYLRNLEGVSPPLSLTHLACQTTAKAFTATLFDRMFSIRSDAAVPPLGARVAAVAAAAAGPRRHFLYCTLKPDKTPPRAPRSREL
ncbi:hypothetical protein BU15DRAFT_87066 [Melanogaster broomeanus]|nr:hypothetical protein BU15DRAFT_87066 [Melanogaster broomeanus]